MPHWAKTYVFGDEVATVRQNGRMYQVDGRTIRQLVYDNAKDEPIDEFKYGPGTYLGYDEEGPYVKVLVED